MGGIIYWGLLRTAVVMVMLWFSYDYFQHNFFWIIFTLSVYLIVIHPIVSEYKKFISQNKNIISNSLCAKCKHFNETAVLCMKYDEHPKDNYTPCDGVDWEVK